MAGLPKSEYKQRQKMKNLKELPFGRGESNPDQLHALDSVYDAQRCSVHHVRANCIL
jgi:hypothetical protein